MSDAQVNVLLFSDDSDTRQAIKDAVGVRVSKDAPTIVWHEAATAFGVHDLMDSVKFAALVLDAESPKEGGLSVARELATTREELPPLVVLTARPQDEWLATWAGAAVTIPAPFDPIEVQESLAKLLTA